MALPTPEILGLRTEQRRGTRKTGPDLTPFQIAIGCVAWQFGNPISRPAYQAGIQGAPPVPVGDPGSDGMAANHRVSNRRSLQRLAGAAQALAGLLHGGHHPFPGQVANDVCSSRLILAAVSC